MLGPRWELSLFEQILKSSPQGRLCPTLKMLHAHVTNCWFLLLSAQNQGGLLFGISARRLANN